MAIDESVDRVSAEIQDPPGGHAVGGRVPQFTPEQIAQLLKQEADGVSVREICQSAGISELTFYRWRGQAVRIVDGKAEGRVKALEEQLRTLRRMLAFHALDIQSLRDRTSRLEGEVFPVEVDLAPDGPEEEPLPEA